MPIPNTITRDHVLTVINQIDNGRIIEPQRNFRTQALFYNNRPYPVKILISWANEIPNHQELLSTEFIADEAVRYLVNLGFTVRGI